MNDILFDESLETSSWFDNSGTTSVVHWFSNDFKFGNRWTAKPGISMSGNVGGYYEFLPETYDGLLQLPILIFLHGAGQQGDGNSQLGNTLLDGLTKVINTYMGISGEFPYGMAIICPQYTGGYPGGYLIQDVINYVKTNYKLNTKKLYLSGYSMGGAIMDNWGDVGALTDVAAIVIVAGAAGYVSSIADKFVSRGMPLWFIHGYDDEVVEYQRSQNWKDGFDLKGINPAAKITLISGSTANHGNVDDTVYNWNSWSDGGLNPFTWMLQQENTTRLIAAVGSFTLNANNAQLKISRLLNTQTGVYNIAVNNATFSISKRMSAASLSLVTVLNNANLNTSRKLLIDSTSYQVTVSDTVLRRVYFIPLISDVLMISSSQTILKRTYRITCSTENITITSHNTVFFKSSAGSFDPGVFFIQTYEVAFPRNYRLSVEGSLFETTSYQTSFKRHYVLKCESLNEQITQHDTDLILTLNVMLTVYHGGQWKRGTLKVFDGVNWIGQAKIFRNNNWINL